MAVTRAGIGTAGPERGMVRRAGSSPHIRPAGPGAYWARVQAQVVGHTLVTDAVLALLVAIVSTPWLATTNHYVASWLLEAGLLVPLVWRRRYPVAVFATVCTVALVQWVLGIELVADVSMLVALSTVATFRPRKVTLAAAAVVEAGAVLASLRWTFTGSWPRSLVFLSGLVAAGLLLGTNLRSRRELVSTLVQRADRLERERDQEARLAAANERARIAREMHDMIGHSLAVMTTLADGAAAKVATDPTRARSAISTVADLGRQALGDTRRLLGVLGDEQEKGQLEPQPGLTQLPALAQRARQTGLDVVLDLDGGLDNLPEALQLTVFRIVQEAITNTLRHAIAPTSVLIKISQEGPHLDITVADDGRPQADNGHGAVKAVPRPVGTPLDRARGGGQGLIGMRERAAVFSGWVSAGPEVTGWVVRARLRTAVA